MALSTCVLKSSFRTTKLCSDVLRRSYCANHRFVKSLVRSENVLPENSITVKGWVRAIRSHKDITFIDINDGSCLQSIQVVLQPKLQSKDLTYGCSVSVEGKLMKSSHKGQLLEVHADNVNVVGKCNPEEYPFQARKRHTNDYIRQFPHLRCRTNSFGALLRLRNTATMAIHSYFQDNGFINVNTPIITSNDCEGAGELFQIEPSNSNRDTQSKAEDQNSTNHFFDVPAYLTVSGQLHLEVMASALSKVYTLGPTFRAENSQTRRHLAEFYMLEAEMAFTDSLEDIMLIMENCVKCSTQTVLEKSPEDVELFFKFVSPNQKEILKLLLEREYKRITYTEAINILQKTKEQFKFSTEWGSDLQSEHENFLVQYFDNTPVFVTDYPASLKPFYARENQDKPATVAAVDLLVPGVGELFGGSLREERLDLLQEKLIKLGLQDEYDWYIDLRRHGSVSHGGFGMGFERYLQCILGIHNIKDVIPFPRFPHSCML